MNVVIRFAMHLDEEFKTFRYSGPDGTILCSLFTSGILIGIGNIAGRGCIVIHTLDRYWKIVHPVHHRKYYRRWMFYPGMILAWLLGIAVRVTPAAATSRVVDLSLIHI